MNVKVETVDKHKVTLHIDVPADVVKAGFKKAVSRIANQVNIPGFRRGKANRAILEMRFGKKAVEAEAQDVVINDALTEALTKEKMIPVTTPDIKQDHFSEKDGCAFTATFVKEPDVKLGQYKELQAEHKKPEVTDAQVMAQLEQAAQQSARLEKAPEGIKLSKGDVAIIDFKGTIDGKPFEGGEGKTYPLEIGSQSFIPGFEDQLEGHKAGENVTVKVAFPKDYFAKALAGKDAEFAVKINDVKRKVVPKIDDALAKSISQFDTLDALKKELKQQMQLQAMQSSEEAFHQALIDKAVANSEVDIPQEMIDQRIDEIEAELKLNLEAQNMQFDAYLKNLGKTEAEFRKDYQKQAEKDVREGLVLGAIADKEGLKPTNQDLSLEIYSMAHQFNADPNEVLKIIRDQNRVDMLYNSVRRKKAAAFIYGSAMKAESDKKAASEKGSKKEAGAAKGTDYASMTVKELKDFAKEHNISLKSGAKKADIVEAIEKADVK
jgi:trigger factor